MSNPFDSTDDSPEPITEPIEYFYDPLRSPKRKIEFTPQSDGRYTRTEAVWTGCTWPKTGREIVRTMQPL